MVLLAAYVRTRRILYNVLIQGSATIDGGSTENGMRRQINYVRPSNSKRDKKPNDNARIRDLGRVIEVDFATLRDSYATPKHPIVLAHGLMGFGELRLAGKFLPSVRYWRRITEAIRANGNEVIIASVPATGTIEERALKLGKDIATKADGKSVNIIAHSMGGLDARYMISRLRPSNVKVVSLTTIATPHRGSTFVDFCFEEVGPERLSYFYRALNRLGLTTGAFAQLTRKYMETEFNPNTPDDPQVRYFSYGAACRPSIWSPFRQSHKIVERLEGPNDGLVSVASSKLGSYKGTLIGCSHLDLINWTNRLKWIVHERHFNAVALYMDITDMLAKEGL